MEEAQTRELYTITHSERQAFLSCQLKHHFAYEERLSAVRKAPALWIGTYVHLGLDAYYSGKVDFLALTEAAIDADIQKAKEDYPAMWPEDEEKLEGSKVLVLAMLEGWPGFLAEHDLDQEFEIVATELEFELRLPTPNGGKSHCIFRGKVDGIARHLPTGNLFLVEHKTAKQVGDSYIEQLQRDPQVPAYMAGVRECHGYETIGCIYNILRQQMPGPRVKAPLYYREWVWRSEREIQEQIQWLYHTYRAISKPRHISIPNRSPMTCPSCSYKTICLEDTPEARTHFTVKDRKHSELEA
jgi:hypothetical protein